MLRFNTEGPDGLHDRSRPGRPERLSEGQQAALKAPILAPAQAGAGRGQRLASGLTLCEPVERSYGVRYSLWGLSCLLDCLDLSRQKTRPSHPKGDPAAPAAFNKATGPEAASPCS